MRLIHILFISYTSDSNVSKELCTQIGLGNPTESEDSIVVLVMGFHYDKR
jgi:hypothetical protein